MTDRIRASGNHGGGSPDAAAARYRPDVDGLRAIAVLSVLFYHLGLRTFRGGFVGVDVFFVISGFLITRLIHDECAQTGAFSFRRFYVRRVRRLVPAHLFVSILCTIWAALVLAPPHLKMYGGALASALASCSNLYFWTESGYFDPGSSIKPLLHTWSLGVEEQFYLVWPAALVLAVRSRRSWLAPALLFAAGVVSLAINPLFADGTLALAARIGVSLPPWLAAKEWLADGRATIFYLLPFRVFEFAIGALLVWLVRFQPRSQALLDACVAGGLMLIACAVVVFDDEVVFPSFRALVPCVGAALCIYAGQARRSGLVLRNPLSVRIGLMSYSLYLVHWPLIVFWRYPGSGSLAPLAQVCIVALSLATAAFMLKWVEQPFRKPSGSAVAQAAPRTARGTVPGLFAVAACLVAVGMNMWSEDGWAWRFSGTIVAEQMKFDEDDYRAYVWKRLKELQGPFSEAPGAKMLIVGDSMAADFTNVAFDAGLNDDFEIRTLAIRDSCASILPLAPEDYSRYRLKPSCPEQNREAAENPNWRKADVVVLSFLWNPDIVELLRRQMPELRALAPLAKFVLVGPKAQAESGVDLLSDIARQEPPPDLARYRTRFPDLQALVLSQMSKTAAELGARLFDISGLFCAARECLRFNEFGNMLLFDNMHLTPKGAEFVGRELRRRIDEYPYFRCGLGREEPAPTVEPPAR